MYMFICLYVYMFICSCVHVFNRVDISMVGICYASDVIKYDRRASELSNAPLIMKQDVNSLS